MECIRLHEDFAFEVTTKAIGVAIADINIATYNALKAQDESILFHTSRQNLYHRR